MVQTVQLSHFNLQMKILGFFGLWQRENSSWKLKLRGFVTVLIFVSITFILPITNLLYFGEFFEEIGSYILFYSGPNFKILIFLFRMKTFIKIVDDMNENLEATKNNKSVERLKLKTHSRNMTRIWRCLL
jgi:hypothetical protein